MAEKEIRLCKNIAKFSQNLPFQLAKFCILDAKFDFSFCKKPRGQAYARSVRPVNPGWGSDIRTGYLKLKEFYYPRSQIVSPHKFN